MYNRIMIHKQIHKLFPPGAALKSTFQTIHYIFVVFEATIIPFGQGGESLENDFFWLSTLKYFTKTPNILFFQNVLAYAGGPCGLSHPQ